MAEKPLVALTRDLAGIVRDAADIPSYSTIYRNAIGNRIPTRKVRGQWTYNTADLPAIAQRLDLVLAA